MLNRTAKRCTLAVRGLTCASIYGSYCGKNSRELVRIALAIGALLSCELKVNLARLVLLYQCKCIMTGE